MTTRLHRDLLVSLLITAGMGFGCHRIASWPDDECSRLCGDTTARLIECGVSPPEDEAEVIEQCLQDGRDIEDVSAECLLLYNDFLGCLVDLSCDEFLIGIGPDAEMDETIPCGVERRAFSDCYDEW